MKEALNKATKYVSALKSKLSDTNVPQKHKGRESSYREFLERELKKANAKIDDLKFSGAETKK